MVEGATSSQLGMELTAAVLKKAQSVRQVQGEAAIKLIQAANLETSKLDTSVHKGQRIDTVA